MGGHLWTPLRRPAPRSDDGFSRPRTAPALGRPAPSGLACVRAHGPPGTTRSAPVASGVWRSSSGCRRWRRRRRRTVPPPTLERPKRRPQGVDRDPRPPAGPRWMALSLHLDGPAVGVVLHVDATQRRRRGWRGTGRGRSPPPPIAGGISRPATRLPAICGADRAPRLPCGRAPAIPMARSAPPAIASSNRRPCSARERAVAVREEHDVDRPGARQGPSGTAMP